MGEETAVDKKFQQAFENLKSDEVKIDSAEQKVNSPRKKNAFHGLQCTAGSCLIILN